MKKIVLRHAQYLKSLLLACDAGRRRALYGNYNGSDSHKQLSMAMKHAEIQYTVHSFSFFLGFDS